MHRERPDEYRRIEYILGLLKGGLSSDQISSKLERRDFHRSQSLAGKDKEVRVQRLLETAPYVEKIDRTGADSPEDNAGYDLYAYLLGIDSLDAVGIQVKSSQRGIDDFLRKRVDPRLRNRGADGIRQWLVSRRLVIINGSLTDAEIVESFVGQVDEIAKR